MLTPAFHFSILETFLETFIKNSALMMEKLKKKVGSVGFDIFPYMSDCALDIICGKLHNMYECLFKIYIFVPNFILNITNFLRIRNGCRSEHTKRRIQRLFAQC